MSLRRFIRQVDTTLQFFNITTTTTALTTTLPLAWVGWTVSIRDQTLVSRWATWGGPWWLFFAWLPLRRRRLWNWGWPWYRSAAAQRWWWPPPIETWGRAVSSRFNRRAATAKATATEADWAPWYTWAPCPASSASVSAKTRCYNNWKVEGP